MPASFSVQSVTLLPEPKDTGRSKVLAYASVRIGGLLNLPGVAVFQDRDGTLSIGLPRTRYGDMLTFVTPHIANDMRDTVLGAMRQLFPARPSDHNDDDDAEDRA